MTDGNHANRAHARAVQLSSQGRTAEAAYYFINALTHSPGNLQIIEDYSSAVQAAAEADIKAGQPAAALEKFDWLEAFILDEIGHVEYAGISKLLNLGRQVEKQKAGLCPPAPEADDPQEMKLLGLLARLKKGKLDLEPPDDPEQIQAAIQEFEDLRDYALETAAVTDDDPQIVKLAASIGRLRTIGRFDVILEEGKVLLAQAGQQPSTASAAFCLQACENAVRELAVQTRVVDADRQARFSVLLADLQRHGDDLEAKARTEESRALWASFLQEEEGALKTVRKWEPPKPNSKYRQCQNQIEKLGKLLQSLNTVAGRLTCSETSEEASKLAAELNQLAAKATAVQHQRYNKWVMQQIQTGFRKGLDCLGIIDNEEQLGVEVVKYFGDIDTRYLTADVQRCFTEVFEHLFSELKRPKKADDFTRKGRKLKVLKDMFAKEKTGPSSF